METPCLQVTLTPDKTWLSLEWEGNESFRGALPPLEVGTLGPVEALLNALSLFFPTPMSIVFIVDAWGASSAPLSSRPSDGFHAAPECRQSRHDRIAGRVAP